MSGYTFITQADMEHITTQVMQKSKIATSWNGCIEKIDIDYIIEFVYDIEITWENIDNLDSNGIILAAIKPSDKIIIMNESKKDLFIEKMGTMNFSKAHELGHWILHVAKNNGHEQITFLPIEVFHCRNMIKRHPIEVQADMFAASLLMPKDIISEAVNELKQKGYVTFPELYKVADEFEVSISALTNRIKTLGLLYIKNKTIYNSEDEAIGQIKLF